jgi:hypothetical protein
MDLGGAFGAAQFRVPPSTRHVPQVMAHYAKTSSNHACSAFLRATGSIRPFEER